MKPKPEYARDRDMPDTFTTPLIVSDEKGRRFINRDKFGENFFALRLDNYPLQVPPSSKVLSGFSVPEESGHAGDFEVSAIVGMGTAPFLVNMSEVGIEANAFSNNAIHHNLFAGAGGLPFVLSETAFFVAGRFVQVEVTNLSSSMTGGVRLALLGRKFNADMPPDQRELRTQYLAARFTRPFWLTLDRGSVSLSPLQPNAEAFMTMPSGSHFVAETIMAESTGPFEFKLFDGHSGRELTYGFLDSRLLAGSAGLPARTLGSPLVQSRRSVRILINDISGAPNVVWLTLHGRRMRMPVG